MLIAEAYWDLEWELQQQGFDFCYDKRLYDRLVGEDASRCAAHLRADVGYQRRLVRFLENHDEPRQRRRCDPVERERAAAVAIATLPGATLWHEGQFDGRRVRLPVFLGRRPDEDRSTSNCAASTVTSSPRSRPPGFGRGSGRRWTVPAGRTTRRTRRSSPGAGGTATGGTWSS